MDEYLRQRLDEIAERIQSRPAASKSTPRFVGQVYDGGSMPDGIERVYLTRPCSIDGVPSEGATGTITPDTTRSIPVVVLGATPEVGDNLIAEAVGGRWVSRIGSGEGTVPCVPCGFPMSDLTLSYVRRPGFGSDGTATLTYDSATATWTSPCLFDTKIILKCGVDYLTRTDIQLDIEIYNGGSSCVGAVLTRVTTKNPPGSSARIILGTYVCSPLMLEFSVPGPFSGGYSDLTITE